MVDYQFDIFAEVALDEVGGHMLHECVHGLEFLRFLLVGPKDSTVQVASRPSAGEPPLAEGVVAHCGISAQEVDERDALGCSGGRDGRAGQAGRSRQAGRAGGTGGSI